MRKLTPAPLLLAVLVTGIASSGCAEHSEVLVSPVGKSSCADEPSLGRPVVVANYNIKSGMWTSLDEVGDVLQGIDADVIALEEVDDHMKRSGGVDESAVLAERLGAQRVFAGAMNKDGGTYGIALLSRIPIVGAQRFSLPDAGNFEPRVGIDATVCDGADELRVVATHADVLPWAARAHAKAIAERVAGDDDVLVLGDLNSTPASGAVTPFLDDGLTDALALFGDGPTFGTMGRIDYILTNRPVDDAEIVDSDASDHRPVFASLADPKARSGL